VSHRKGHKERSCTEPGGGIGYLGREPGLAGPAALAVAGVAALALGLEGAASARARVDLLGLADDEAVLDELADVLAAVGHGDFVHLIGVEPHLALAALEHAGGQALLQLEGHHGWSWWWRWRRDAAKEGVNPTTPKRAPAVASPPS
jgi:hypothetical protein